MTGSRVVLHVGLPKTGTSFLQQTMRGNRGLLARAGVALPPGDGSEMFLAMLDLTRRHAGWGRSEAMVTGAWDRVARAARAHQGTTVLSSEMLCLASEAQVSRAMASLAGCEVHVVVTARDLARQLPAEWQEGVKHGRKLSLNRFLEAVLLGRGSAPLNRRFWRAQDPVGVLARWGADLDPDRVHVVTCPRPDSPRGLLWERFASLLGDPPEQIELPAREINTSLGRTQIELLRRLNQRFRRSGREVVYGNVVKRLYAGQVLSTLPRTRVELPDRWRDKAEEITAGWIREFERRGYDVVGDLSELAPQYTPHEPVSVPDVSAKGMLAMSLDATALLLEEVHRLQRENRRLRAPKTRWWSRGAGRVRRRVSRSRP